MLSLLDSVFLTLLARGVAVDQDGSVYVADSNNQRLMKWSVSATQGVVIFGDKGIGNRTDQLNTPAALIRDKNGTIFVVDERNDRIVAVREGTQNGIVIAGGSDQLNSPIYLAFNRKGDLYISDSNNFRVQVFTIENGPVSRSIHIFVSNWSSLSGFLSVIVLVIKAITFR